MALTPTVLTDARIYFASADLTGAANKIALEAMVEDLDKTTFASGGAHERVAGLWDTKASAGGLWRAGDLSMPDDTFWAQLGQAQAPLTVAPALGTVGSLAWCTRVLTAGYKLTGDEGKLLGWDANWSGNWPLARGAILHPQGTARTATGNGTGVQVGALSATQAMYVTLHVLAVSGTTPSLTVALQSDTTNAFAAPTTQATFNAATALGGQTAKVNGAVAGTWWRVNWTITGTTPSFLFAVAAGIGPK